MKRRILLADHDESVRKMLARVLETAGYAPLLASTPAETLDQVRFAEPEVLLLDLQIPGERELVAQLTQLAPDLRIVVLAAWPTEHGQTPPAGVAAVMEKPFDLPILLEHIASSLNQRDEAHRNAQPDFSQAYQPQTPEALHH